jgi:thiol-disulfide isomerase/thioredoxin
MMRTSTHRAETQRTFRGIIEREKDPEKRAELEKRADEYNRRLDEGPQESEWTYCTFREIQVNGEIPGSTFDTSPPDGAEVRAHDSGPRLPVPIGEPGPDATVFDLQGKEVKLSDFRGKVLLIDLWATWCDPCQKGLPDTMSLAKAGKSEGFAVLAVCVEDSPMIKEFLIEEGLQDLPVCTDPNQDLSQKYKVMSIPTVIIIDAKGNLAAYLVGLRPAKELRSALDKARRS